jgi:hypothetical protein
VPKTYSAEKTASSTNSVGKSRYPKIRWKLEFYLSSCTKINLKCIKDLYIRLETTTGKQ